MARDPKFDERRGPQGPRTRARGWYGHFPTGAPRRRLALERKIDAAWDAAIEEERERRLRQLMQTPAPWEE